MSLFPFRLLCNKTEASDSCEHGSVSHRAVSAEEQDPEEDDVHWVSDEVEASAGKNARKTCKKRRRIPKMEDAIKQCDGANA